MALGEKYRVYCDNQYGTKHYYFRIYWEGFSGSVTELTGSAVPVEGEVPGADADPFDVIFGSEFVVRVLSLTDGQFNDFASAKNREVLGVMHNYTDNSKVWQGWLVPTETEEPHIQPPYETTMIFNCGLGQLNQYEYLDTDGSYFTGRALEKNILVTCIKKIYPATMTASLRPALRIMMSLQETTSSSRIEFNQMDLTYVDRGKYIHEDGTVMNCREVVEDILKSYGCRIQMSNYITVVRIRDLAMVQEDLDLIVHTYDEDGDYVSAQAWEDTDMEKTLTGPQDRATMIGWIGSMQVARYQRAYRRIQVIQDYLYNNILLPGTFISENWTDFWTTSGTVARAQSADNTDDYYIRIGSTGYIEQVIENLDYVIATNQTLIISFEAMMEFADTVTHTLFRFDVRFFYDGPGTDNFYLDGQIGGTPDDPNWVASPITSFYFTTESGKISARRWMKFELAIDLPSADGDLQIRFNQGIASGGSGSIDATCYKNIKLFGTYDHDPPGKNYTQTVEISEDNINDLKKTDLAVGDITDQSGNEWVFFRGAKSLDADGLSLTNEWRSTYKGVDPGKTAYGPGRTLAEYIMDGRVTQHGAISKRLTGTLSINPSELTPFMIFVDNGVTYIPTSWRMDFKRSLMQVSMVELPAPGQSDLTENLITEWTNDSFISFISDGDEITTIGHNGSGTQSASANELAWGWAEKFDVVVTGVDETDKLKLEWGAYDDYINDGDEFTITQGVAGSEAPQLYGTVSQSHTDVKITIKRTYGY